jgi:hypothetical protein
MRKVLKQLEFDKFKPSEYMRARRPELFSDTHLIEETRLKREVFEYHLDSLTSRKQEYEFEHFCRRLAEKELCPNLLPQTGPTGGGDSKTDTETYPVADNIALRWLEGIGQEASQERWAFAFSAKKAWQGKIRQDVDKIVKTNRGHRLIYFISNQFIKDKTRAEEEDKLTKKHNVQVRILDRSWIVDRVFKNGHQQLAIETLGLTEYEKSSCRSLGSRDTQRESELKELEGNIQDPDRYRGVEYQLAEDCMQAALLARNLERPRTEVDGLFDRAERIAEKVNYRQQRMRIAYIRTWSVYFWYDDADGLKNGYDNVEKFALGSEQSEDIEKLVNLWVLLSSAVMFGQLDAAQSQLKLKKRKSTIEAELNRLASNKERPRNALLARIHLLLLNIFDSIGNAQKFDKYLDDLAKILRDDQPLLDYSFESLSEIIQELGKTIPNNKKLDQIFESVLQIIENRTGKGSTGRLLLKQGYQKLQSGKKYEAIRLFGRAQDNLAADEYREEFIASLVGCAHAYESAGLLWAARRNILLAVNKTLGEFWKHGVWVPESLDCLQKLIWLEIQLGRVPYILSWMDVASVVAHKLVLNTKEQERFKEDRIIQDGVLGLLLLKTKLYDLKWLDFLPNVLDKMGLFNSWMALLFALGHEEHLRNEKLIPADQSSEDVLNFFDKWLTQPASRDIPNSPELLYSTEVTMDTFIIGCHLTIETANEFDSICLGETILAVMEAFLATGMSESIFPYQQEFKIRIRPSEFVTGMPKYRMEEKDGIAWIEIRHASNLTKGPIEQHEEYCEWLQELMTFVLCQIAMINEPGTTFEKMAKEGAAFSRALGIVDIDICIKNVLGKDPRFCLWGWKGQTEEKTFPLQRSIPWFEGRPSTLEQTNPEIRPPKLKEEEELYTLSGIDNLKHRDIRVHSVINIPLWDKAKWKAMVYVCFPNEPPSLVFGFTNPDAGKAIFKNWQSRFGKADKDEYLRISIITGIDEKHPYSYSIVVGVDPEFLKSHDRKSNPLFMLSRIHRMDPINPENLQRFLARYKDTNSYTILPARFESTSLAPELFPELGIKKRKLRVCEAWQIDENDFDICAVPPDANPIIPKNIKDPPILRAIEHLKKIKNSRASQYFGSDSDKDKQQ